MLPSDGCQQGYISPAVDDGFYVQLNPLLFAIEVAGTASAPNSSFERDAAKSAAPFKRPVRPLKGKEVMNNEAQVLIREIGISC